jgi:hypothetical protein
LFDWQRLKTEASKFPHIRIIADTGVGKTTLADWLIDILGGATVITPKKKPQHWVGLEVIGCTPKMFNFEAIKAKIAEIQKEMYRRYDLIEKGEEPPLINFTIDEWRLIIKSIPESKEILKELITVAREANLRLIGMAQGKQVSFWGFEEESDLEECFTDILIGEFAIEHCLTLRRKYTKNSEEYAYLSQVLIFLKQSPRPCMVGNQPAIIPDLSVWKRKTQPSATANTELLASQVLGEPLRTIWKFAKEEEDWITTRDVLRRTFSTLKTANTEEVQKYFLALSEKGYGEIDLSGKSPRFRVL